MTENMPSITIDSPVQSAIPFPHSPQPFRLLDLPKELRLMIYERLPQEIKYYRILLRKPSCNPHYYQNKDHNSQMPMMFIKKTIATSILATCKTVYEEANAIVQTHIQRFITLYPGTCPAGHF
jgi:hypothetical protein